MRKHSLRTIFFLFALIFCLPPHVARAQSAGVTVVHRETEARVCPSGDLEVEETLRFRWYAAGETLVQRFSMREGLIPYRSISVSEWEDGNEMPWRETTEGRPGETGLFQMNVGSETVREITLFAPTEAGAERTFCFRYRVEGVGRRYEDRAVLDYTWQVGMENRPVESWSWRLQWPGAAPRAYALVGEQEGFQLLAKGDTLQAEFADGTGMETVRVAAFGAPEALAEAPRVESPLTGEAAEQAITEELHARRVQQERQALGTSLLWWGLGAMALVTLFAWATVFTERRIVQDDLSLRTFPLLVVQATVDPVVSAQGMQSLLAEFIRRGWLAVRWTETSEGAVVPETLSVTALGKQEKTSVLPAGEGIFWTFLQESLPEETSFQALVAAWRAQPARLGQLLQRLNAEVQQAKRAQGIGLLAQKIGWTRGLIGLLALGVVGISLWSGSQDGWLVCGLAAGLTLLVWVANHANTAGRNSLLESAERERNAIQAGDPSIPWEEQCLLAPILRVELSESAKKWMNSSAERRGWYALIKDGTFSSILGLFVTNAEKKNI